MSSKRIDRYHSVTLPQLKQIAKKNKISVGMMKRDQLIESMEQQNIRILPKPQIGEIYKKLPNPQRTDYFEYYEIKKKEEPNIEEIKTKYHLKNPIYVCDADLYGSQIHSCGYLDESELIPLRNNKKDREIIERIKKTKVKVQELMDIQYNMYKRMKEQEEMKKGK